MYYSFLQSLGGGSQTIGIWRTNFLDRDFILLTFLIPIWRDWVEGLIKLRFFGRIGLDPFEVLRNLEAL